MFNKIKEIYGNAKNSTEPPLEVSAQPKPEQSYVRHTVSIPQYDSRTLGIDIQGDIEKVKNVFRGRRLDAKGKKFIQYEGSIEIINEAGAEFLLSNHENMLSIANATTNIKDENFIRELCEEYADDLLEIILSMEEEWELNASFFDLIIDTLVRNYQLFLLKSLHNLQRKLMLGVSDSPQPQQQMPYSLGV
jgi:hypothetical protein